MLPAIAKQAIEQSLRIRRDAEAAQQRQAVVELQAALGVHRSGTPAEAVGQAACAEVGVDAENEGVELKILADLDGAESAGPRQRPGEVIGSRAVIGFPGKGRIE